MTPVADGQTCARCGADKAEVRKYRILCEIPYWRHRWIWTMGDALLRTEP